MNLNDEQKRSVEEPIGQTVKIMAGAGTGKTRVLAERYLKFVTKDGIDPDRLLALTFTKKAAGEMHSRVFEEVVKRKDEAMLRALYGAWIMNFHQFAFRVIKENAASFGIDPDVGVASEVDVARLRRRLEQRFHNGKIDGLPQSYEDDMPIPNRMDNFFGKCMKIVESARGSLWTPDSLMGTLRSADVPPYKRYLETIVALWRAYEHDLHSRLLLDFNDMIRIVVDEFRRNEPLRKRYADHFEHILVDEFQDTSEVQNEFLRLLSGDGFPRVTVVGDEKQSIYRWRDARVDNIREFPSEPLFLKTNYRSTQGILDVAFHVLIEDEYFKKHADDIRLVADRGTSEIPITVFHPPEGDPSPAEEARALGAWIVALTADAPPEGTSEHYRAHPPRLAYDDIAVLMRTLKPSSGLPYIEEHFRKLGIPYTLMGGVSEIEEQVLELFKNVLRLLIAPGDVRAFLSVIEAAPLQVPDKSIGELFEATGRPFDLTRALSGVVIDGLSDTAVRERLGTLRDLLDDLDQRRSQLDLPGFVGEAMERTQFFYQLFSKEADLRGVDSISKRIFEIIERLMQRNEANLAAFLEAIETLLNKKQFGEEDAPYVPEGRVVVMTQHQAKGLQFKAVAVPGIKKGPSSREESFYLVRGEGLYFSGGEKWGRGSKDTEAREEAKIEGKQEERCLLYVAMTRAKDHLFLSSPFAGGIEKYKKENLFAAVLRAAKGQKIPHEEWRDTPEIGAPGRPPGRGDGAAVDVDSLIEEWRLDRERIAEARVATKPALRGLQFVGWHGLQAFEQCPLRYYYRYVAGVQTDLLVGADDLGDAADDTPRNDARYPGGMSPEDFGSLVHRFLAEWSGRPDTPEAESRKLLDNLTGQFGLKDRKRVIDETLSVANAYRARSPWEPGRIRHVEWPVQRRFGNVVLHGVVDRLDQVGGDYCVVDYKLGKRRDEYAYQIQFYALVLEGVLEEPVSRGLIAYLGESADVTVPVASEDRERIKTTALELGELIEGGGPYPAHPGKQVCGSCDFRDLCPHTVKSP